MTLNRVLIALLGGALSLPAQFPDFTPPTPLIGAAMRNDAAEVKRLLEAGADPNEGQFIGAPPIFMGLFNYSPAVVEEMIAKGANAKATDARGSTTLMWAAYNESAETTLVEKLLKLGVDPNAKNKEGETALMWARKRGHTAVVEVLKRAGASDTEDVKRSVEKAIALLQKSGPEFFKVSGCVSCHNQSLPQMAFGMARERGFAVDPVIEQQQVKAVVAIYRPGTEKMEAGTLALPDVPITVSYALVGLAAEGYTPDATTAAMANLISTQQLPNGSFLPLPGRPPIESSYFTATALSIRAIQFYAKKNPEAAIERARGWLETATPKTTEDRAMQLLGLSWSKGSPERMRAAAAALLAEQRPDGGWAQLPGIETDAYATGQALVALHTSGQLTASDPAYQRGVDFLLRTQLDDGSWFVRTRSNPFQPYKESGFPHGRHQWISAAGSSWAAMALTLTQPSLERISRLIR